MFQFKTMRIAKKTGPIFLRVNTSPELGDELRAMQKIFPFASITSIALAAISAGLPTLRREIDAHIKALDADD